MTSNKDAIPDPVCGIIVPPDSPQRFTYNNRDFVFCSPRCLELFQNQPERYLEPGVEKPEKPEARTTAEGEEAPELFLTCPMHPEVKEPVPRCPKCGMFLQASGKVAEKPSVAEKKVSAPAEAVYACPRDPHPMDLPNAPGDRQGQSGNLPGLRHGFGDPHRFRGREGKSGAQGHAPPVLGCPGANPPCRW